MMKNTFIFFLWLLLSNGLLAQNVENIKVTGAEYADFLDKSQYKYPLYAKAKIAFKNGETGSAQINFNYFLQTLTYLDNKGDTMEISNSDDVSYFAAGLDTIFYDNGYYHWVASSGTVRLAMKQTFKEGARALVGAFGTASPAKNVEAHTKILNDGVSSKDLSLNEVVTIRKEITYYIGLTDGAKNKFVEVKKNNLTKLFPKKKVEEFLQANKINLNKEEDLIDLMIYLSKQP